MQRKLMQCLGDARLLHGHTVDADRDLDLLRLVIVATLGLFDLLRKLQPPNGVFDGFDTLGLVDWCGAQKLQSRNGKCGCRKMNFKLKA